MTSIECKREEFDKIVEFLRTSNKMWYFVKAEPLYIVLVNWDQEIKKFTDDLKTTIKHNLPDNRLMEVFHLFSEASLLLEKKGISSFSLEEIFHILCNQSGAGLLEEIAILEYAQQCRKVNYDQQYTIPAAISFFMSAISSNRDTIIKP